MSNQHLFELINAGPGLGPFKLMLAMLVARWLVYLGAAALALAWVRGDASARRELVQMLFAAGLALLISQIVSHVWPQPRPLALHLGTQYLDHANDPGLPSDHATLLWSLGLSALGTRRFGIWAFPLLTLGLVVGVGRVYLGVHFPYDVLAALPIALAGACVAHALSRPARPLVERILCLYDRLAQAARALLGRAHKA